MLAPETSRRVRDRFFLRSLGQVSLKNLSNPVEAWEVEDEQHAMAEPSAVDEVHVKHNGR